MDRYICCAKCEKVVGREIVEARIHCYGGWSELKHDEIDYRKASRVWGNKYKILCKKCAKQMFPEGYAYKVVKPSGIYSSSGEYGDLFATKKSALDFDSAYAAEFGKHCTILDIKA